MRKSDSYKEWLDWDWEQADAFEGAGSETIRIEDLEQAGGAGREHCLEVLLRISGTLLVRTYAVAFTRTEDIPDYGQMTVGGHGKQAVIPGSSWARGFPQPPGEDCAGAFAAAGLEGSTEDIKPIVRNMG